MSRNTLAARIQALGGNSLDRINKQKLASLKAALKNDYNSRMIKTSKHSAYPALITTMSGGLKANYDMKYVSVDYDAGLEAGDVFEILEDNTFWMVYLPVLTETAYLRSEIIRCRYVLEIDGEKYRIAFRGPEETDLRWFIKSGVNINELNLSGTIFIKLTPKTRAYFERFSHIKVDGHIWEVQVTDSISVPGILELEVQEYYDNPIADLPEIKKESDDSIIVGKITVEQDSVVGYYIPEEYLKKSWEWEVSGNPRVKLVETLNDGNMCKVKVYDGAVDSFTVSYGDYSLEVNIDWERNYIKGPAKVSPYGFYKYKGKGTYSLDTPLAKIVSQDGTQCEIEILTGRKGEFVLTCLTEDNEEKKLPIVISSFTGGKDAEAVGSIS